MSQLDFTFDAELAGADGLKRWQEQRRQAIRALAHRLGLPIGRAVEVWLADSVRLRGVLKLHEEVLFPAHLVESEIQLVADGVVFKLAEIESCVRTD